MEIANNSHTSYGKFNLIEKISSVLSFLWVLVRDYEKRRKGGPTFEKLLKSNKISKRELSNGNTVFHMWGESLRCLNLLKELEKI